MIMRPAGRKLALAVHLTSSIGWIGAVLAYLALGAAAVSSDDAQTVRGAWIAMEITGWWVIVPLAVASWVTGVVMALGTRWGLLDYYWVLIAFVLTTFATVVLILHMPGVSSTADVARGANLAQLNTLGGDLFHPAVGLVVLLAILVLNIYKPRGVTRWGWRKEQDRRARSTHHAAGAAGAPD